MKNSVILKQIRATIIVAGFIFLNGCVHVSRLPNGIIPERKENNLAYESRIDASSWYVLGLPFHPSAVADAITYESQDPATYWLLPNSTSGNITLELSRIANISKIRLLNTHNSCFYDRGTRDFRVEITSPNGKHHQIWSDRFGGPGGWKEITFQPIPAKAVTIYVDSYYKAGGGLNEIEIYEATKQPIAPVSESGTLTINANRRSLSHSSGLPWAFVVGISTNKSANSNLDDLAYADNDAEAFMKSLKERGWADSHIKVLTNEQATKRNIEIALESWLTKAGTNDLIVLFWSGHGFPDPEDPEKVYFACYDTDPNIPATGYRMDRVVEALKERGVRNVIVLADTCHAGKLITRGDKGVSVRPYMDKMERDKTVPKGWIFMVAADSDRKAIEHSSWKNGAFTHCLLKGLNGEADGFQSVGAKDGRVTMLELRTYLERQMPEETQKILGVAKHPLITTSTGDSSIWQLDLEAK